MRTQPCRAAFSPASRSSEDRVQQKCCKREKTLVARKARDDKTSGESPYPLRTNAARPKRKNYYSSGKIQLAKHTATNHEKTTTTATANHESHYHKRKRSTTRERQTRTQPLEIDTLPPGHHRTTNTNKTKRQTARNHKYNDTTKKREKPKPPHTRRQ